MTDLTQLEKSFSVPLVSELQAAYEEAKRNFYLGGLRLSAVEGGRFCEAAFRMLEFAAFAAFTPIGQTLDTEKTIKRLANLPKAYSPSIRLHIPRALRMVYDVRNQRDAAHLADGIDPNLQDATFVISTLDWVMAEFIRLYHGVSPEEAQRTIEQLVARRAPAIQSFDGFLKVLNPTLKASEAALLLMYERGGQGASFEELSRWVPPKMRKNLRRTLAHLEHERALVHSDGGTFRIAIPGVHEVESKRLHEF